MERETVAKASVATSLELGTVTTPVRLYKVAGDPKGRKWEAADREGREIKRTRQATRGGGGGGRRDALTDYVEGDGGKRIPVKDEDVRRGIRREDGSFVDLTDHLKRLEEEAQLERMEVVTFIDSTRIPAERIIGNYYVGVGDDVGPDDAPPSRMLKLLQVAMRERRRAAVVRLTKRKGQQLAVIRPVGKVLLLTELAWFENVREPNDACLAPSYADVSAGEVEQAAALIDAMAGRRGTLDDLRDRHAQLAEELVARAQHGELDEFEAVAPEADPEMDDLGALLGQALEPAAS